MKYRLSALVFPALLVSSLTGLVAKASPALTNSFYAMDTAFQRPGLNQAQQLDLVKELGYAGVAWHQEPPAQARAMTLETEAHGLTMFTIYCSAQIIPEGDLTYSPELPALMEALKSHHTIIWLHFSGTGPAIASLTGDAPVVKKLRTLAQTASANGLRVALYPHFGEWTARFGDATRVAKLVNHPALGVTFNLCHCLATGDEQRIPELLTEAAPVLTTVTINGADSGVTGANWNRLIQPLNRGRYDVGIVLRQLERIGFTGPIGFQGYGITGDARSILQPTIAKWRELQGH